MKRALVSILLMGFMGAGTALAQDGWQDYHRDRRDIRGDRADIRNDRRDIRQDEAQINHDRWELRRDLRNGDYRAAAREREELRE